MGFEPGIVRKNIRMRFHSNLDFRRCPLFSKRFSSVSHVEMENWRINISVPIPSLFVWLIDCFFGWLIVWIFLKIPPIRHSNVEEISISYRHGKDHVGLILFIETLHLLSFDKNSNWQISLNLFEIDEYQNSFEFKWVSEFIRIKMNIWTDSNSNKHLKWFEFGWTSELIATEMNIWTCSNWDEYLNWFELRWISELIRIEMNIWTDWNEDEHQNSFLLWWTFELIRIKINIGTDSN
jgi:hypothetical protein